MVGPLVPYTSLRDGQGAQLVPCRLARQGDRCSCTGVYVKQSVACYCIWVNKAFCRTCQQCSDSDLSRSLRQDGSRALPLSLSVVGDGVLCRGVRNNVRSQYITLMEQRQPMVNYTSTRLVPSDSDHSGCVRNSPLLRERYIPALGALGRYSLPGTTQLIGSVCHTTYDIATMAVIATQRRRTE